MRIVALSDQHGFLPDVPRCDLLIVAGDVYPDRVDGKLDRIDRIARKAGSTRRGGAGWPARRPRTGCSPGVITTGAARRLPSTLTCPANADSCGLHIVVDGGVTVHGGPGRFAVGVVDSVVESLHAVGLHEAVAGLGDSVRRHPSGIDILVTHQPPLGYGDLHAPAGTGSPEHLGNPDLLAAIDRVRPRLVVCGHIHGGHGHFERNGTTIYNVSVVDDCYRLKHAPTIIDVPEW